MSVLGALAIAASFGQAELSVQEIWSKKFNGVTALARGLDEFCTIGPSGEPGISEVVRLNPATGETIGRNLRIQISERQYPTSTANGTLYGFDFVRKRILHFDLKSVESPIKPVSISYWDMNQIAYLQNGESLFAYPKGELRFMDRVGQVTRTALRIGDKGVLKPIGDGVLIGDEKGVRLFRPENGVESVTPYSGLSLEALKSASGSHSGVLCAVEKGMLRAYALESSGAKFMAETRATLHADERIGSYNDMIYGVRVMSTGMAVRRWRLQRENKSIEYVGAVEGKGYGVAIGTNFVALFDMGTPKVRIFGNDGRKRELHIKVSELYHLIAVEDVIVVTDYFGQMTAYLVK